MVAKATTMYRVLSRSKVVAVNLFCLQTVAISWRIVMVYSNNTSPDTNISTLHTTVIRCVPAAETVIYSPVLHAPMGTISTLINLQLKACIPQVHFAPFDRVTTGHTVLVLSIQSGPLRLLYANGKAHGTTLVTSNNVRLSQLLSKLPAVCFRIKSVRDQPVK